MNLTDCQAYFAARILDDPALGLLSEPIQYSLLDDERATAAVIKTCLAESGVAFVIDPPFADSAASSPLGATMLNATVLVMVAESPTVAHTPSGVGLVAAVISAITRRSASLHEQIACAGYDEGVDENGYALHVVEFRIQSVTP